MTIDKNEPDEIPADEKDESPNGKEITEKVIKDPKPRKLIQYVLMSPPRARGIKLMSSYCIKNVMSVVYYIYISTNCFLFSKEVLFYDDGFIHKIKAISM